jgi:hypothetical protein
MALISTLQDNFDDNSFNSSLWSRSSGTEVLEQNQQMELKSSTAAKWLRSISTYDLTASSFQFKYISHSGTLPPTVGLQVQNANPGLGAQNQLAFDFSSGGNVRGKYSVVATFTYGTSVAIGSYQYFRIREVSGTIYWDASADSVSWTNIFSVATPITITSMYAFAYAQWPSTASLFIDSINVIPSTANAGLLPIL